MTDGLDLGTGDTTVLGLNITGKGLLDALKEVETAEQGRLFMSVDGKIKFVDRNSEGSGNFITSQATFSDKATGAEIAYSDITLTFDDLGALPQTGITADFQCVTGWRVNDVPWSGVLLSDLLREAGVKDSARALRFLSFDGVYTESLTLEQSLTPDVLVATSMWGKPITREHGGPVRLYVVPMYGYKSLKWLSGIELGSTVIPGYWEQRGYDIDAWVGESNGRNDDPIV